MPLITRSDDERLCTPIIGPPTFMDWKILTDSLRAALVEIDRLTLYGNKLSDEYRAVLLRAEAAEAASIEMSKKLGYVDLENKIIELAQELEKAEAQLRKWNEGWEITEKDVRRIQASDKEIRRAYQVELAAHSSTTRNLREAEADEKWMREHFVDLIFRADGAVSLHAAGIIGRVIEPTIHAAVEAAKKEKS